MFYIQALQQIHLLLTMSLSWIIQVDLHHYILFTVALQKQALFPVTKYGL